MKISPEIKVKVFAQYPSAKLLICEPNTEPVEHYLEGVDFYLNQVIAERVNYNPDWIKLILKPIYSITDQDLIECCFVSYPLAFEGNNKKSKWTVTRSEQNFATIKCKWSYFSFEFDLTGQPDIITMYHNDNLSSASSNICVYQYLQEEGYDLRQRLLDGSNLKQAGLAIYLNKTYTDDKEKTLDV